MMKTSYWLATKLPRFPAVSAPGKFDVIVIGGGIMGITAALLLKQAGKKVALLEKGRFAQAETGHTTAHVTCVTDLRLSQLVRYFGDDHARAVWEAGDAALQQIEALAREHHIECEFRRVPGFLHASLDSDKDERRLLKKEAELAQRLGFDVIYTDRVPFFHKPGMGVANQGLFHPLKYLAGLLALIPGDGCEVFEKSEAEEFSDDPLGVTVHGHQLTCDYLVIATHVPLMGNTGLASATLMQSKLMPYSTYAIGADLPKGKIPEASYWDTTDPYYYLRIERGARKDYAIFGGADHKTGQVEDTDACYERLEQKLREYVPEAKVTRRWSGQVIETNDGLPYIGETAERQFVATGFSGNGMTFGTLGAMMARDAALAHAKGKESKNPWRKLFSVDRKKLRGGTWDYLTENIDYPYYMVKDRLTRAAGNSLADVQPGEGKIIKQDGQKVAAYRGEDGTTSVVSAVCTHMGCLVHWNQSEATWDCPCHGSRFKPTGEVLAGPAESPLAPITANEQKPKPKAVPKPKSKTSGAKEMKTSRARR